MSEVVIQVDNLGKKYELGRRKSGDLRQTVRHAWKNLWEPTDTTRDFWALRELSFEVFQGDIVGIIGRNGAGKSTLLKILSRITEPTEGRFWLDGRVSSLLEVGTGFHFELTGRENIFLNGTILGMHRAEIKRKFDEIVSFSGVEDFIDTPVKHYSSGMRVRLAFSVAAHLEPEILIVDEVLAVGDAEFQKKCIGKMDQVSKAEGRTILFVSHNLPAVSQLCSRGILLSHGRIAMDGKIADVVEHYITHSRKPSDGENLLNLEMRKGNGMFKVKSISLLNSSLQPTAVAITGSPVVIRIDFDRPVIRNNGAFRIDFALDNEQDVRVGWYSSDAVASDLNGDFPGVYLKIPKFHFGSGVYYLTFYITWHGDVVDYLHQGFAFNVEEGDFFGTGKIIPRSQTFIYAQHEILKQ